MRGGGRWVVLLGWTTSAANRRAPFTFLWWILLLEASIVCCIWARVVPPRVEQEVTVAAVATVCRTGTPHELDRFSPPTLPLPSPLYVSVPLFLRSFSPPGFLSIISAGHAPSRQIRYTNGPHGCPAVQIGAPTHDRRYYRSPTSSAIEQVSRTKTTTGCSQLVTPF